MNNYATLTEKVCNAGGQINLTNPVKLSIINNEKQIDIVARVVIYKYEYSYYPEDSESLTDYNHLVVMDENFHSWDIDDYLTETQINELIDNIPKYN